MQIIKTIDVITSSVVFNYWHNGYFSTYLNKYIYSLGLVSSNITETLTQLETVMSCNLESLEWFFFIPNLNRFVDESWA